LIRSKTGKRVLRGGVHSKGVFAHTYQDIISVENLLEAWKEFRKGKRNKLDVLEFQSELVYQVTTLHTELVNKTYRHAGYHAFKISDPKPRDIHKATVRDRLLHHAIYRVLYPYFDKTFIHDSYSCRTGKGTRKALNRFRSHAQKSSRNHTRTCWVLKCDIRKFFASIDHRILLEILQRRIKDQDTSWLLGEVIGSFYSTRSDKGLPLGNLTSQLLVNIYMNEFDQFVKHQLKAKYYIRYADDFVLLSYDKAYLQQALRYIEVFLREKLKLQLHPAKLSISTAASGVDFLGWVHFPHHRVLRTATKRRMFRRLQERKGSKDEQATRQSYFGMLLHGNTEKLTKEIAATFRHSTD
jgi:retron-type reverse transcriptase